MAKKITSIVFAAMTILLAVSFVGLYILDIIIEKEEHKNPSSDKMKKLVKTRGICSNIVSTIIVMSLVSMCAAATINALLN